MLVGYARVSTQDQNPRLQLDALKDAGCEKVFVEKASGAQRERPGMALDTLEVCRHVKVRDRRLPQMHRR